MEKIETIEKVCIVCPIGCRLSIIKDSNKKKWV